GAGSGGAVSDHGVGVSVPGHGHALVTGGGGAGSSLVIAGICTGSAPATKRIGGRGSGRVISSHGEVHVRVGGLGDEHLGNGGVGGGLLHGLDAVGAAGQSVHL